jgi:hypothetical protein
MPRRGRGTAIHRLGKCLGVSRRPWPSGWWQGETGGRFLSSAAATVGMVKFRLVGTIEALRSLRRNRFCGSVFFGWFSD